MAILQRTLKTKNNKFGIKKPKLEEIDLSKNTIFIFPGSGATDERSANGYCKIVEQMISKDVANIYSFYYDDPPKEEDIFNDFIMEEISENYRGKFSVGLNENQQNEFVEKIMVPLFFKDGKILSEEKAKENFSKITFFSHCQGTKEIAFIFNETAKIMQEKGYTKKQAINIFSTVRNISYAPHIDKKVRTEFGTHIKFCSAHDRFYGSYWTQKFNKNKEYLGIGKIFLENNHLTVFSDNFGGSIVFDNDFKLHKPILHNDHDIDTLQIFNEDALYQQTKKNDEQSQRALIVYDLISMCLCLSLVDKNADISVFEELIKNQINISKTLESEKEDVLFFLNRNPKIKFEDYLEKNNLTEDELLSGTKNLKDVLLKVKKSEFNKDEIINSLVFENTKISRNDFVEIVCGAMLDNIDKDKIKTFDLPSLHNKLQNQVLIFEDGIIYKFNPISSEEKNLKLASLLGDVNKAVIVAERLVLEKDKKGHIEKRLSLELKKPQQVNRTQNNSWQSFLEIYDKTVENLILLKQQTRTVVAMLMEQNATIDNMTIEDGITLNQDVLNIETKEQQINIGLQEKEKHTTIKKIVDTVCEFRVKKSSKKSNSLKKESKEQKFINN